MVHSYYCPSRQTPAIEFFHKGSKGNLAKHGEGKKMKTSNVEIISNSCVHALNDLTDLLLSVSLSTIESIAWRMKSNSTLYYLYLS